jgi:UDP-3-O-[3-hydroxymyristoyl] glucosamine N-acyltransferase
MKLSEIIKILDIKYIGKDIDIHSLNTLEDAQEGELAFFQNAKYLQDLKTTRASAVLVSEDFAQHLPEDVVALITDESYLKLAILTQYFAKPVALKDGDEPKTGTGCHIQDNVNFGKNVILGKNVTILSGSYIGDNVVIGDDSVIYANVSIYSDTIIGNRVIIHSGTVVGSDGFGFAHTRDGRHIKIHHLGYVHIEDDVEVGANTCLDKGVFGKTLVKSGSKIDNLIQVAHNCVVGSNSLIAAQSGLAGSTTLGDNVVMGAQSGSAGHLKVGDMAQIAARTGITKSIEGKKVYAGFPAQEHDKWLKYKAKLAYLSKKRDK